MAPDKKDNKRKAATATVSPPAKKTKKVEAKSKEAAKDAPKSILKKKPASAPATDAKASASSSNLNGKPTRQVKPRKRAADFLSEDEDEEAKAAPKSEPKPDKKKVKNSKKVEVVAEESDDESEASVASEEDEAEDDQTTALIKGFESSGDEDASDDEGFDPDQPVPRIPDSKKAKRKILKKQKKSDEPDEPGTVYVGRIPHGFYEHQMRAYFSQFGDITRLRLSRNRITGRSKHYAFVEFSSVAVAKIVAETMDNYLMYGHILKCRFVPKEQLHPEIWKGANRRFKKTPWNRIEKKRLEKGKTRDKWSKSIDQEQKRRLAKAEKLKALGYEFEIPQLKSVDDVPMQDATEALEAPAETDKAIEAAPAVEATQPEEKAESTPKKAKKEKKAAKSPAAEKETPKSATKNTAAAESTASPAAKTGAKAKKTKKSKISA
ncbi:hypothetical protein ASPZODRAFT_100943 [Penicilliopsis zonata CBS 506.65]|uniref:RRM domain-containing protein n=1 Tax=Penicilliopsis zonata CBS 506.65 TaxID=1073090 RepID=A0A1L9SC50_9EURO|nr:hypothetical protein ASPZODRAFT_100943 [Penicilliopsis zonata CBS 506.65]OJJ44780.1 hypothetical protein ASPZODRAFT_100943 [Penicilliopsis zonata CBS 506.65]